MAEHSAVLTRLRKPLGLVATCLRHIPRLSLYWTIRLALHGVDPRCASYDPSSKRLSLDDLDIRLSRDRHVIFLKEYNATLLPLVAREKAAFFNDEAGEIGVEVDGARMILRTWEELFILGEIFLEKIYALDYDRDVVVLDIGMNVGFASLYYAARENVHAVFGYEPFRKTYEGALHNFSLNPELSKKIRPFNTGAGASDTTRTLDYCHDWKGMISTTDGGDHAGFPPGPSTRETVEIRNIVDIVDSARSETDDCEIIAKIDCEGAEYEILEVLDAAGRLSLFRAMIIEWHDKGPGVLVRTLEKNGFRISARSLTKSGTSGMIYAARIGKDRR